MRLNEDALAAHEAFLHPVPVPDPGIALAAAAGLRIVAALRPLEPPKPRDVGAEVQAKLVEGSIAATRKWMTMLGVAEPAQVNIVSSGFTAVSKRPERVPPGRMAGSGNASKGGAGSSASVPENFHWTLKWVLEGHPYCATYDGQANQRTNNQANTAAIDVQSQCRVAYFDHGVELGFCGGFGVAA